MATATSSRLRSSSLTNRRSMKSGEATRKTSALDANCKETHSYALRSTGSNIFQSTYTSDHDFHKASLEKSSDETVAGETEREESANREHIREYDNALADTNLSLKQHALKNEAIFRRNCSPLRHPYTDYPDLNVSQAILAMQKLQRLKELQRKRDLTERYYSHEIRKLIGDYFTPPLRTAPPSPVKQFDKLASFGLPSYGSNERTKSANFKALEPCGTMTTITRLHCGCVQETTRPIFTTTRGRVQKKACSQSQDEMVLKLTSSNPQEHLCSPMEGKKMTQSRSKSKKRVPFETKIALNENVDDVEEANCHKGVQKSETIGRATRNDVPPIRAFSNSSTTS